MKQTITVFLLFIFTNSIAQLNLTPMPNNVVVGKGNLILKEPIGIITNDAFENGDGGISLFKNFLTSNYKISKFKTGNTNSYGLPTEVFIEIDKANTTEAYSIDVQKNSIKIKGSEKGIFYAFETLKQLITKNKNVVSLPLCKIKDEPRFEYRGMHLDVCRHFFTVDYIKKYIDYLAAYKYNTFHWHLTEDQGWRIEIKKYPLLTSVGAYRDRTLIGKYGSGKYDNKKYGGYYTQVQIKEIVKYAASKYITVIPEIEMPGHSTAALASYPYLGCTKGPYKTMDTWGVLDDVYCAGNDSTFTFLQNVMDEVVQLFPAKYIHIGGDECPKERWKKCASCQQRMKDNNLKDEHALQSYFIQRMEKYINSKGKKIIGWDEILEGGLAPNATVMSWRGEQGGIDAAKEGHDVIMTPGSHCYLDHSQSKNEDSLTIGSYLPLSKIYNYEPIPAALNAVQSKHVLGAQGNVWTEYISNTAKLEYMIFPRMIALSEALWTKPENKSWKNFEDKLPSIFERLDNQKINYSKAYYDLDMKVLPSKENDGLAIEIRKKILPNTYMIGDFGVSPDSIVKMFYKTPEKNEAVQNLEVHLVNQKDFNDHMSKIKISTKPIKDDNNKIDKDLKKLSSIVQQFHFNKATGKKITLSVMPNNSYPGDGPFTLVNGIQNTMGTARASEFLGFLGKDVEVTIDFGKEIEISTIKIHTLNRNISWIYLPSVIEVTPIPYIDPNIITRHAPLVATTKKVTDDKNVQIVNLPEPTKCNSVRIYIKNFGKIPAGSPGEGTGAWLFLDEIEVN